MLKNVIELVARPAPFDLFKELIISRYRKSKDLIFESEHERNVEAGMVLIQHFIYACQTIGRWKRSTRCGALVASS